MFGRRIVVVDQKVEEYIAQDHLTASYYSKYGSILVLVLLAVLIVKMARRE